MDFNGHAIKNTFDKLKLDRVYLQTRSPSPKMREREKKANNASCRINPNARARATKSSARANEPCWTRVFISVGMTLYNDAALGLVFQFAGQQD